MSQLNAYLSAKMALQETQAESSIRYEALKIIQTRNTPIRTMSGVSDLTVREIIPITNRRSTIDSLGNRYSFSSSEKNQNLSSEKNEFLLGELKPSASQTARTGWLWWKSSNMTWRRAYAIATYIGTIGVVQFYHSEEDQRPYRLLHLHEFVSVKQLPDSNSDSDRRFEFKIISNNGESFFFAAETPAERKDWGTALGILIKNSQKQSGDQRSDTLINIEDNVPKNIWLSNTDSTYSREKISRVDTLINNDGKQCNSPESESRCDREEIENEDQMREICRLKDMLTNAELRETNLLNKLKQHMDLTTIPNITSAKSEEIQNIVSDQLKSALDGFQNLLENKTSEIVKVFSKTASTYSESLESSDKDSEPAVLLNDIWNAVFELKTSMESRTSKLGKMIHEISKAHTIKNSDDETEGISTEINTVEFLKGMKADISNINSEIIKKIKDENSKIS
ncbi:hypothetical protein HK096_002784, partial [Nowakowskiella sp. JEL0078]